MRVGRRDFLYIVGILAAVFVLGGLGFYAWYTEQLRVGPPSYCPTGTWPQEHRGIRVPGRTVILIDTSDSIEAQDGERAIQDVTTWTRDTAPFLQRLSAYGLPERPDGEVEPISESFCVPKEGDDANIIYENPVFVEAEFRRFLLRLEAILRVLIGLEEADRSPIAETMADLVDRHDDLDSFVLVSDMLQNTPAWSHYKRGGDPAKADSVCDRITESGRVRRCTLYYIDRGREDIQMPEWPDEWWRDCLGDIETRMLNPMWSQ